MRQLFILLFIAAALQSAAQPPLSVFDPATTFNKMVVERNHSEGSYIRISNYKVAGTPFLYGEKNLGNIYSVPEKAYNIYISYSIYAQKLEFYSTSNPNTPLTKDPGTLDSFLIKKNAEIGIPADLLFVYGAALGSKDKAYYQLVAKGKNVNLYKRYSSELGIMSDNYIQQDLRQFIVNIDYYYTDSAGTLKKLKTNASSLIKEFKNIKDISTLADNERLTLDKEKELLTIFEALNQ
jgi:hypothetical protein